MGVYDTTPAAAQCLARRCRPRVAVLPPSTLASRCQLLIEAASAQALGALLPHILRHRKALLALSTGGLLKNRQLLRRAVAQGIPIYLPSGAVAGLDGIKAARLCGLRSMTLTTRKPPQALADAPYVRRKKIRLDRIRKPRLLFEGSARQAVLAFPQNINVAATLTLAAGGTGRTRVRVIADPTRSTNRHEVHAVGRFGSLRVVTDNRPSRANPRTSALAASSAVATLRQILEPLRVGT